MDKAAITDCSKNLQKATAASAPGSTIIAILNDLKTNLRANEDLLRSTKIGIIVNRSKTHADPAVAKLASECVKKWREDISKQKSSGAASPNGSQNSKTGGKSSPSGIASPVSNQNGSSSNTGSGEKKSMVAPADRNFTKDKVNISQTSQATRDNCVGLIYNGLCFMSTLPSSTILTKAVEIEAAGFAAIGPESNPAYSAKFRSLFMNLKNKGSKMLREKVLSGAIAPDKFVVMSAEELKSKERREGDEKLKQENLKDAQMPQMEKSISSAIQCKNPKCVGKNTVAYSQAQTRRLVLSLIPVAFTTMLLVAADWSLTYSADEPMTTFCECQSCGRRWKFS